MAGFAYYVIQRNDTINDSIFHMSNGMQGAYSKMLGLVYWNLDSGMEANGSAGLITADPSEVEYTVCPRSSDTFYIVT